MKRILPDTHTLIWALENPRFLSTAAADIIQNIENQVFVSQVSFFEVAIKQVLGKITLQRGLLGLIEETKAQSIEILPLSEFHLIAYSQMPLHAEHRDPFDRAIIATAFHEQLEVITTDEKFKFYPDWITVIW
jgi:PIN domain nuclease of toxin-antitoxin system